MIRREKAHPIRTMAYEPLRIISSSVSRRVKQAWSGCRDYGKSRRAQAGARNQAEMVAAIVCVAATAIDDLRYCHADRHFGRDRGRELSAEG